MRISDPTLGLLVVAVVVVFVLLHLFSGRESRADHEDLVPAPPAATEPG